MAFYKVPFLSQEGLSIDPGWRNRACGVVSLKMMLDYWHSLNDLDKTSPIMPLIQEGVSIGAYIENIGWSHAGLVNLARQYGYDGYNRDLPPLHLSADECWQRLVSDLAKQPVMVSVWSGFDPKFGGGHIAILTGFDGQNVTVNDPARKDEARGRHQMPLAQFLNAWKQRYIVVSPKTK